MIERAQNGDVLATCDSCGRAWTYETAQLLDGGLIGQGWVATGGNVHTCAECAGKPKEEL